MSTVANLFSRRLRTTRREGADRTAAASRRAATHHPPRRPARQPPCATSSRTRKRPSAPSRLSCEFARSLPAVDEGQTFQTQNTVRRKPAFAIGGDRFGAYLQAADARPAHHHALGEGADAVRPLHLGRRLQTHHAGHPRPPAAPRPRRARALHGRAHAGQRHVRQRIRADERGRRRRARARLRERRLRRPPRRDLPPGGRARHRVRRALRHPRRRAAHRRAWSTTSRPQAPWPSAQGRRSSSTPCPASAASTSPWRTGASTSS